MAHVTFLCDICEATGKVGQAVCYGCEGTLEQPCEDGLTHDDPYEFPCGQAATLMLVNTDGVPEFFCATHC